MYVFKTSFGLSVTLTYFSPLILANPLPPMTHPLPAKPVPASSSYRPAPKRERTPEVPEPKRPPPRTDWPSTSSSANYQLQSCGPSSNPSIQKIVFNSDGTLMALICMFLFYDYYDLVDELLTIRHFFSPCFLLKVVIGLCGCGRINRLRVKLRGYHTMRLLHLCAGHKEMQLS